MRSCAQSGGTSLKLALLLAVVAMTAVYPGSIWAQGRDANAEGEVLVKIRANLPISALENIRGDAEATTDEVVGRRGGFRIRRMRSRSRNVDALLTRLRRNPNVVYAEPNGIVHSDATPNDANFVQLWGLQNTGQYIFGRRGTRDADVKAADAWSYTTGSPAVVIAVVDTGVDYTHPDLQANIWSNPGGVGGCTAGTHGYNAINGTCDPMDDNFHGTHVAGILGAAGNNSLGVTGVNWTTSIMALKFLDGNGDGTVADAIKAIDFAIEAKQAGVNVRVVSASWGYDDFSQALEDEINEAKNNGILIVASAGNVAANIDITPHYPASLNSANVISVAATDNRDQLASFSGYGASSVDLGAPGIAILSTMPSGTYGYQNGTSMAVPYVSGAAALLLAANPGLNTADVKQRLLENVDVVPALQGVTVTGGRLNIYAALTATSHPAPPSPTITQAPPELTSIRIAAFAFATTLTGATFECSLSASVIAQYTDCNSPYTSAALPDGRYTFSVRVRSGSETSDATSVTFTVDTLPPTVTVSQGPPAQTNSSSASFQFSSPDAVRFDCSLASSTGADNFSVCTSPKSYPDLAEGTYTFKVRATDAAGNLSPPVNYTFTYTAASSGGGGTGQGFRDDFSSTVINPAWVWMDPLGNSQWSLNANPGHLQITVPAGSSHNCWPELESCARMMRALVPGDFVIETKIDGQRLGGMAQAYGILLWQDPLNYLRFEFWTYGQGVRAIAFQVSNGVGVQATPTNTITMGSSNSLRVTRTGNSYQLQYSTNGGGSWKTAGSFTAAGFVPTEIGLEVGNYERMPSTTANFDFFSVSAQ